MAFWDKFKRQKNTTETGMPAEVQEYYKSERRDRKGMAWILAVVTLIVTFAIAAALFFGGRWAYRAIFDNNDDSTSQTQEQSENESSSSDQAPAESDTDTSSQSSGQTSSTNTTTTPPTTSNTPNTPSVTTPVTGPNELVNTGPGDE